MKTLLYTAYLSILRYIALRSPNYAPHTLYPDHPRR